MRAMAKTPRKTFTFFITRALFDHVQEDDDIGYDDLPRLDRYRYTYRPNLETGSRAFLSLLKEALEDPELVKKLTVLPDLDTEDKEVLRLFNEEKKNLSPVADILSAAQEILDRTPEIILKTKVSSPDAFYQAARYLDNVKILATIGRRKFVLPFKLSFYSGFFGATCSVQASYWVHDRELSFYADVDDKAFKFGALTVEQVFTSEGITLASPAEQEDNDRMMRVYQDLQDKVGQVVDIETSVYRVADRLWRATLEEFFLGTKETPRRLILEPELEVRTDLSKREGSILPLVRVFSPDRKDYIYAHVDDLRPHNFDLKAKSRVVLPSETRNLLNQIFDTPQERVFGDMFGGRNGGVIVLASGSPGVGKTITAEAFAESCARPLYVLGIGELGTNADAVETALALVFDRVRRWNAVLLLDEGDIFLTKRQADDLERSAIVGVFLRVLDQYQGILMITTNRPDVLDPALLSRVTIHFQYPDFDPQARQEVWRNLLDNAGLAIAPSDLAEVGEIGLNGRTIRNLVRLIGIRHPGQTETSAPQIKVLQEFTTHGLSK